MKSLLLLIALAAAGLGAPQEALDPSQARARAEAQVKADLGRRKDAGDEAIRVVEVGERIWPDERLGCGGDRRTVAEPIPVVGYRIVLSLADRHYVYHSDRAGRFVPCDRPAKPIDRIR